MRAVLAFGHNGPDASVGSWVRDAASLDPTFKPPVTYGALMVAAEGDVAGHETLLRHGLLHHPTDPWFPAALGMSRLLDSGDPQDAARWLRFAADLPGGDPSWARMAAQLELR